MLPTLRFILGAALASLLLILTMFGLATTVRLTQQAKVSPLKPARTLAYASPAGRSEFDYDDRARHFEAAASIVPLHRDESLSGATAAKPAEEPQQNATLHEPQDEPLTSTTPQEERSEIIPPQENAVEVPASIAADGDDRLASAGSAAPAKSEPPDPAGSAIEPNMPAAASGIANPSGREEQLNGGAPMPAEPEPGTATAEAAAIEPDGAAPMTPPAAAEPSEGADLIKADETESAERGASAKRAEHRGARMQKAKKSKAAAHPSKAKNTVAKRKPTLPPADPLAAGIGFPRPQNWSSAERGIFAAPPATKLASSQPCGLGSAICHRPLLQAFGPRQASFQRSRTQPALSHPQ